MGVLKGQKGSEIPITREGVGVNAGVSSTKRRRWAKLMPFFVALVVVAEIIFLGRLDMVKNATMVRTWTNSFYFASMREGAMSSQQKEAFDALGLNNHNENCEDWLEQEDAITYSRDFEKKPILVSGAEEGWISCSVGCKFGFEFGSNKKYDAKIGSSQDVTTASVIRSMESSQYYPELNIKEARWRRYNVVMTTSLSSDVPVGYFSWAEYEIMAPLQPKVEISLAAAFISNCRSHNFRLEALEGLEKENIKIDSYGICHRNRDGSGAIPVVVGAPNIQEFAPSTGSVLHIKELSDIPSIAKAMKYLAENPDAYNQSLRWKYEGPSDSFKALVDMAAVHSSCRLCIYLASKIRESEERNPGFQKRPCKCTRGLETIYHIYVRERGRFEMDSIFLRSVNLTLNALESAVLAKFKSSNHVPIWKKQRPESIKGDELKIYRIYPVGMTQRQALYTFKFNGDSDLRKYVESHPCPKFEVIFV
ncbi:PREDICTED: glycoprotein 3-alpha-L-fucosyltransferase A-like isoform X2 [Nelumbo nucifera]|uniref:Fucosyltransferase n=1 Tax=Nelumbo nucifera TaxID=4432 RepID=A0A1U8ATW6_NELNU|nr:PREDICTED: glycoprotein 3-alpha-L-fucosyltransferase A-like isoform X2 [Nelumbo nucifera]